MSLCYFSDLLQPLLLCRERWFGKRKVEDSLIQGGLATAFDLAAFRLSMIAPVKESVNHPKNVATMRETGWENNKFVVAASSQRFGSVK